MTQAKTKTKTPPGWSERLQATVFVRDAFPDEKARRGILEMLGLVAEGSSVLAQERRGGPIPLSSPDPLSDDVVSPRARPRMAESRRNMTTPPGLANLPPVAAPTSSPAAEPRAHKPRPKPSGKPVDKPVDRAVEKRERKPPGFRRRPIAHGTDQGYRAHFRHEVPIDEADSCGCRAAHRLARAGRKPDSERKVARCGTESGLKKHRREKTQPCDDCLQAGRRAWRRRQDRAAKARRGIVAETSGGVA